MPATGSKTTISGSLTNSNTIDMAEIEEKLKEDVEVELEHKNAKAPKQPEKKRTLQWVKGDKIGNVETVAKDDGQWLTFDGGGRISKSLLGEYMMDVAEGTFSADELQLNTAVHEKPNMAKQPIKPEQAHRQKSPVATLLEKSSQQAEMMVKVAVSVKTPTPALMAVLRDSFGAEADQEVEEYMMAQVDSQSLSEAAREEMKQLIQTLQ